MTMTKGFRQAPQANRKERLNTLDKRVANLEMASRINQMMTQQLLQSARNIQEDLGRALGILNETQYKLLAIQEATGLDVAKLNEIVNVKRLKDFDEASAREDADKGFTVGTVVDEKSTVILTSKTEEPDKGIFRSRIEIAKCGVPELVQAFTGREVGAKAIIKLNGTDHEVELLGIRQPPVVAETAEEGTDSAADAQSEGPSLVPAQAESTAQVVGNA